MTIKCSLHLVSWTTRPMYAVVWIGMFSPIHMETTSVEEMWHQFGRYAQHYVHTGYCTGTMSLNLCYSEYAICWTAYQDRAKRSDASGRGNGNWFWSSSSKVDQVGCFVSPPFSQSGHMCVPYWSVNWELQQVQILGNWKTSNWVLSHVFKTLCWQRFLSFSFSHLMIMLWQQVVHEV